MRTCIFIAATLGILASASPLAAQERAPNTGTEGILRAWPVSGAWNVILVRLADAPLGCLLATGHAGIGEQYHWGLRWRRENIGAVITANNAQAVAGPSIQIIVDNVTVGTYQISSRVSSNGFQSVIAEFAPSESDRVLSLISGGGELQFVTSIFTYSAPLEGAQQALAYFKECAIEASHLNSTKAQ
jgi:hypothetical protein